MWVRPRPGQLHDVGFCRREKLGIARGQRYELCRSVHAEANAIISAMCKCMIINAGISRVVIRDDQAHWREIAVSDWVENDDSMTDVFGY